MIKKRNLALISARFGPNFVPPNFFRRFQLYQMLYIVVSCHCMQFSWKTNEPNLRKQQKNLVSGPILSKFGSQKFLQWILPLLDVRHCCKLSLYAISRKTKEQNLRKWQKNYFRARFWPKFGLPFFSPKKNLGLSLTKYYGLVLSCTISEKTNGPILSKLNEGRTDWRTDGPERFISQDAVH